MKRFFIFLCGAAPVVTVVACFIYYQSDKMKLSKAKEFSLENRYYEAFEIYKELAKEGNAEGLYNMSEAYRNGWGVEQSDSLAKVYCKKSADLGFDDARADVAMSYIRKGLNKRKGINLLKKLYVESKSDYVKAKYAMVLDLDMKNKTKFEEIVSRLTESRNPFALRVVAAMYYSLHGNDDKFIEYLVKSYENGSGYSAYLLAKSCGDKQERIAWLNKGIERMSTDCMILYGDICTDDSWANKKYYNPSLGFRMYKRAANLNDKNAYDKLGRAYLLGNGVDIDIMKAMVYFKKSMECGCPSGTYDYGESLLKGRGCTQSIPKAKELMQLAEDRGSGEAALWLANQSIRDKLDDKIVCKHLDKAVKLGSKKAIFFMGQCYESGWHSYPKDEQLAFAYFRKAADSGLSDACLKVAACYKTGFGTQADKKKAKEYENMANNY